MKTTDLLFGVVSLNADNTHKFFCDIDTLDLPKDVIDFLVKELGYIVVIQSGRGLHLANFSCHLTLDRLVELNELAGADSKYVKWIKRAGYGALRISRRSGHFKVPRVVGIYGDVNENQKFDILTYMFLLNLESEIDYVYKVDLND